MSTAHVQHAAEAACRRTSRVPTSATYFPMLLTARSVREPAAPGWPALLLIDRPLLPAPARVPSESWKKTSGCAAAWEPAGSRQVPTLPALHPANPVPRGPAVPRTVGRGQTGSRHCQPADDAAPLTWPSVAAHFP